LVLRIAVYAFENVDLAVGWPLGTVGPKRGPSTAPVWHVHGVQNDEAAVDHVVGVNAHGFAVAGDLGGGLDAHDGVPGVVDTNETGGLGSIRGLIVDGAVCRIW